jgi:CheY-like chemotaxis protein
MPTGRRMLDEQGSSECMGQPRRFRRKRLLLAEDDTAFRMLLRQSFMMGGYEVVAVEDGMEMLETIAHSLSTGIDSDDFDVVVSDVRMPGWTGLNVLASMRDLPDPPPVVLITAFGDERLHEQAERAGAVAVLDKPFELDDLLDLVNRLTKR